MKWYYKIIFVLAVLGIAATIIGAKDTINMSKDPIDMATVDWSTLKKGDHVTCTINVVWDCLYTETTEESTYGITTDEYESARAYVIPDLYYNSQAGYYDIDSFICVKLYHPEEYDIFEKILNETNEWYFDETGTVELGRTTYTMEGVIVEMDREEKDFMTEYLVEYCAYEERELKDIMCPYVIEKRNTSAIKTILLIGIVLDIVSAGLIVLAIISARKEKAQFAEHTYMGVSQTGSTDVYGGPGYGGNNFGGTNYGASNQYNNTYDGSVYGDTSYGGTNTYGQNNTYGTSGSYGQGNNGSTEETSTYNGPWQPYQ